MKAILKERRISALVFPCTASLILSGYIVWSVAATNPLYGVRMMIAALVITLAWIGLLWADCRRILAGRPRTVLKCSLPAALAMAVSVGVYLAWAVWGNRYLTLAPIERLNNGLQHQDTLFHSTLAESFRNSLVPGTLLNSEAYLPYHTFSHLLMSLASRVLGAPAFITYNYMYPALFLPAYLMAQIMAISAAKDYFAKRKELKIPEMAFMVLFNAGFLYDPWLDVHGIWKRNHISSESYMIANLLAFLGLALIFHLLRYPGEGKKRTNLLKFLVIPVSIFVITWCKISVGLLFAVGVMYYIFRVHMKEIRYWGLNVLYGGVLLLALWLFSFMGGDSSRVSEFDIRARGRFLEYCPGPLGLKGHWLLLMAMPLFFMVLEFFRLRKEKRAFRDGKTVWMEGILLIAIVAFQPGYWLQLNGGSAAFFSCAVEVPALVLLCGHPYFGTEKLSASEKKGSRILRNAVCVLCVIWSVGMCWINKPADPVSFVTGEQTSDLSSVLLEVRENYGSHPKDYTIYLDEDNLGAQVYPPIKNFEMRSSYIWTSMTGIGVINATYYDDDNLYMYQHVRAPEDYGSEYTDNDHPITLEEALEKAAARGKKAVIHVTADGYEVLECGK